MPITACNSKSDCRLRSKDCCECGGANGEEGLIAIHRDQEAAYSKLVCPIDGSGCPECGIAYDEAASADCLGGVCTVVWNFPG